MKITIQQEQKMQEGLSGMLSAPWPSDVPIPAVGDWVLFGPTTDYRVTHKFFCIGKDGKSLLIELEPTDSGFSSKKEFLANWNDESIPICDEWPEGITAS